VVIMTQLNNIKVLKDFRKELRINLTPAEAVLWKYLKGKQLEGLKFRRQHSIGFYILDFYCPAEKLAIELDGAHHYTSAGIAYDEERTIFLNSLGIQVIRFENKEVFEFTSEVIERIRNCFTTPTFLGKEGSRKFT